LPWQWRNTFEIKIHEQPLKSITTALLAETLPGRHMKFFNGMEFEQQ